MSRLTNIAACTLLAFAPAPANAHVAADPAPPPRVGVQNPVDIPQACGLSRIVEYGDIRFADEKAQLDNYAIMLRNDPSAQGYIIAYGGRVGRAGEAQRRADRARHYLSEKMRGIDAMRVVTVDGGFREELTIQLWIVTSGATPPTAQPSVDPREVKFIRASKARGRRRR